MKKLNILALIFSAVVLSCTHVLAAVELGSCTKNTNTVVRQEDIETFKFLGYHADDLYQPQCTTSYNESQLVIFDIDNQYSVKQLPTSITITRFGFDSEGKPVYNATVENLQSGFELHDFHLECKPAHDVEDGWVILESCQLIFEAKVSSKVIMASVLISVFSCLSVLCCYLCCCKGNCSFNIRYGNGKSTYRV